MIAGPDLVARGVAARALRTARVVIDAVSPAPENGIVHTTHPLVSGRAPPLALVDIHVNGKVAGTVGAGSDGRWSFEVPAQLNGACAIVARAAPASPAWSFTIDAPFQPLIAYDGRPALLDINAHDGLFWAGNALHASQAELLQAIGASVSGARISFGGVENTADGTEYFPQPGFDSLPALTASGTLTAALAGGELAITSSGAGGAGAVSYALNGCRGRAFRFRAQGRRGSIASNLPTFGHSLANAQLGGNLTITETIGTAMASFELFASAAATGGSSWWGVRGTSVGAGTAQFDNWSLREVFPLAGWADPAAGEGAAAAPGWAAVADIVLPGIPAAGSKVVWQVDAGSDTHRIQLVLSASGNLSLVTRYNAATHTGAGIVLGTVGGDLAVGDRARVAMSAVQGTNGFESGVVASLNGGPMQRYTAADYNLTGAAFVRIGQDAAGGNAFDGTYRQIAFCRGKAPADWCEMTSRKDDTGFVAAGDSYVDGASGVALKTRLAAASGRRIVNIAVGGSTLADQVSRYKAKPYLRALPIVHWDGSDNGTTSTTADLAGYRAIMDAQGSGRALFVTPVAVPNPATAASATPTAQAIRCAQRITALIEAFGTAHVFDALPTLQGLSNGSADDAADVAAGLVPRSCLYDAAAGQVHLGQAAMTAVANALWASGKLQAL